MKTRSVGWMPIGIARHETGTCEYAHLNKSGKFNAGDADVMHTPNEAGNADGGVGLFQITNDPYPDNSHFWSWKKNADAGIDKLKRCLAQANDWMNGAKGYIDSNGKKQLLGGQRIQAKTDMGRDIPVPDKITYAGITFGDGKKSKPIEHAIALKVYNGASKGHFCVWINSRGGQDGYWDFNEVNNLQNNYVERVCSAYVTGGKE